jgi:hypothetical protein
VARSEVAVKAAERWDFLTLDQAATLAEFEADEEALRVISPSSGSIIVIHHSTATRSPVMMGLPMGTATSCWAPAPCRQLADRVTAEVRLAEDAGPVGGVRCEQVHDLAASAVSPARR